MSLNWKEIDLILSELPLAGAKVQKVLQPDFHSLVIECYHPEAGRYMLLITPSGAHCRIGRLYQRIERQTDKLQRFAQLLRSRIIGSMITHAEQIHSDRIIRCTLKKHDELFYLYIRLWGNAGNILLCDREHRIMDAFYRRPGREETSGAYYHPEENLPKKAPHQCEIRPRQEGLSFNEQIDRSVSSQQLQQRIEHLVSQARSLLDDREAKLLSRLSALKKRSTLQDGERAKEIGDLLSANIHRITSGSDSITLDDFYQEGSPVTISLNPKLSPGEQPQEYYRQYQKQQRSLEQLEQEQDNLTRNLKEIALERSRMTAVWEDPEAHRAALKALISRESSPERSQSDQGGPPGLQFTSGHFQILVGRTAKENDQLLRSWTRGNDYWLHARDYPGGYVFIKYIKGKTVPLETLLDAGTLALFFSKARPGGKGDLYYTQVKYLRRGKHGKLGTVLPTQEKNLYIELDQNRLDRLLGGRR